MHLVMVVVIGHSPRHVASEPSISLCTWCHGSCRCALDAPNSVHEDTDLHVEVTAVPAKAMPVAAKAMPTGALRQQYAWFSSKRAQPIDPCAGSGRKPLSWTSGGQCTLVSGDCQCVHFSGMTAFLAILSLLERQATSSMTCLLRSR